MSMGKSQAQGSRIMAPVDEVVSQHHVRLKYSALAKAWPPSIRAMRNGCWRVEKFHSATDPELHKCALNVVDVPNSHDENVAKG